MPILKLTMPANMIARRGIVRVSRYIREPSPIRSIATHTHSHHASLVSILPTSIDKYSTDFIQNAAQVGELIARMQDLHRKIEGGGPAKAKEKHIARGKMLAREYVNQLLPLTG